MESIKILHLTPFYPPNIGGVETHLHDLTTKLASLHYQNYVLTYSPLTTKHLSWKKYEHSPYLYVRRFRYFGYNLFHRLESHPLLNFIYLTPYLLIRSLLWQIIHRPSLDVIHSHGLNAAVVGIIFQKIFKVKTHLVSIYSSYDQVPNGQKYIASILNRVDVVLTQSDRSIEQLRKLGVQSSKIHRYRHWIDTNRFSPSPTLPSKPTVLFIGRMIPPKNALSLARAAQKLPHLNFIFVGTGPQFPKIKLISSSLSNIQLIGDVPYSELQNYYRQASVFCLPSKYDEGWGRVVMEAISCGVPVLATNLGAVPEVVDPSVGILIKPTYKNILSELKRISRLTSLKKNCRSYALRHFSDKNISLITRFYVKA